MQWGAGGPRRCTSQPDHENLRRSFAKRRKAAQGHHNRYRAKTDHPCQRPVQNPSEMGVIANLIDTVASKSEEHTSELQSLMRISYAVFCLKKKKTPREKKLHTDVVHVAT